MLSVQEKIDLSHLEKDVEIGRQASIKMAVALLEIRERQLYREEYSTFEDYCQRRWGFTDRHGRLLVEYGETIREIQASGGKIFPPNLGQSIALNGLNPEDKMSAMAAAKAIAPEKVTAKTLSRAATAVKAGNSPIIGDTVTVLDEDSPHYGQQVEVVAVESQGIIALCDAPGFDKPIPFLRNEISGEQLRRTERSNGQPKPSPIEALQAQLEIEEMRVEILESELMRLIEAIEAFDAGIETLRQMAGEIKKIVRD